MKQERRSKIFISGNSMRPLLCEGSQVIVEYGTKSAKRGDIIVYLKDNKLILHRVLWIRKKGKDKLYLTKGDSALRLDPLISENEVIGVVREIIKEGENIDVRKKRWKFVGQLLTVCSFAVGILSKAAIPFLNIFLKSPKKHTSLSKSC